MLRSQKTWAAVDAWLARWGALAIMALAVFYYAQYYRSELNLGGEGGTTAVIAQRLMEGQLPFIDTYLGYNVMWFYPVVALFQLTGPDFVALRIYFFVLCTAIGVLGFLTVRRVTGIGWLSFAVGTMLILIPGMLFRITWACCRFSMAGPSSEHLPRPTRRRDGNGSRTWSRGLSSA